MVDKSELPAGYRVTHELNAETAAAPTRHGPGSTISVEAGKPDVGGGSQKSERGG